MYRKATHTDHYPDFKSHHRPHHKHSECTHPHGSRRKHTVHRGRNITANHIKRVLQVLSAHNYPTHFLRKGHQSNTRFNLHDIYMIFVKLCSNFTESLPLFTCFGRNIYMIFTVSPTTCKRRENPVNFH